MPNLFTLFKFTVLAFAAAQQPKRNYYKILNVNLGAGIREIKEAYKDLALRFHPDKRAKNNLDLNTSTKKFIEITEAYETLINIAKKPKNSFDDISDESSHYQTDCPKDESFYCKKVSHGAFSFKKPERNVVFEEDIGETVTELNKLTEVSSLDDFIRINQFSRVHQLEQLLFLACKNGKFEIAKYLIETLSINPRIHVFSKNYDANGELFKFAAEGGNLKLIKYLLKEHHSDIESAIIDIFYSDNKNGLPRISCADPANALMHAVFKGHLDIATYLIENGANLNPGISKDLHRNLVSAAIYSDNFAMVKLVVEAGAPIRGVDIWRFAFETGNLALVKFLLQQVDYELCLMSDGIILKNGQLYIGKDENNFLTYSVISGYGGKIYNVSTNIPAPEHFNLESLTAIKNQIIAYASGNKHIVDKSTIFNNPDIYEPPAYFAVLGGNVALLTYLEEKSLNIFVTSNKMNSLNIKLLMLEAAAKSGSVKMMQHLLFDKGLLDESIKKENWDWFKMIIPYPIRDNCYGWKMKANVSMQARLNLIDFLIKEFKPSKKTLFYLTDHSNPKEVNALLNKYISQMTEPVFSRKTEFSALHNSARVYQEATNILRDRMNEFFVFFILLSIAALTAVYIFRSKSDYKITPSPQNHKSPKQSAQRFFSFESEDSLPQSDQLLRVRNGVENSLSSLSN